MTERRHDSPLYEQDSFWTIDQALGEIELRERPSGPDTYMLRLKAHAAAVPYRARSELYPLSHDGTRYEVSGRAYILVPDITLTVGLFPNQAGSCAVGRVTSSRWEGMRHHDIANVRGLYYDQDSVAAIWEVDTWGRLDDFAQARLWQAFQGFLVNRFPAATRIFTDDAEPFEGTERNREFLRDLDFEHMQGTSRIFAKEIPRR